MSDDDWASFIDPNLALAFDMAVVEKQPPISAGDKVRFRGVLWEVGPIQFDGLAFEDVDGKQRNVALLGFVCQGVTIIAGIDGHNVMGLKPAMNTSLEQGIAHLEARRQLFGNPRMRNRFRN